MSAHDLAAITFGLASALSWGAGDFSGGLATKRAPVFGVLAIGQGAGLLLLVALALLWGEPALAADKILWGIAAGVSGAVGLVALYRGLAIGRMGIVAPMSAVLAAALPALGGALLEGPPGPFRLAGFGLALAGVWLLARPDAAAEPAGGLGLALIAGGGFGAFFILIHQASATATFWPLAVARTASLLSILVVVSVRRRAWAPPRALLPLALLSGALDVAGNAFFVLAAQAGRLDVAAILSSMYPASTVLLAALLLGERVTRAQGVGIAAVLAAIAFIAG